MKILLITAYFPPEIGSAAHLFADLGKGLAQRGHVVTVLTGYPTYNVDRSTLREDYLGGIWMREQYEGMQVIRVRTFGMPRQIPVLRGLDQLLTAVAFGLSGIFLARTAPDVILVYSPPLFLGLTALALKRMRRSGVVLNVQDLFPQSAIDLGVLRSTVLIRLFRSIESFVYRRAEYVTVHSPGNKQHVERCGGNGARTLVVPNVVDTDAIVPGPRNNEFRDEHHIPATSFIVSFAGVLGYSQDLDSVIDAAKLLSGQPDILFYIVGDGVEKPRLMERAKEMRNVVFLPMLTKEMYRDLLHASDVCLATLRSEVRTPVVPSKILSIMAAGRPVVAGLPLEGDAPKLIEEARCGICVESQNPEKLAEALRLLYHDRRAADDYGKNGRAFAVAHLSIQACVDTYENLFKEVEKE